MSVYENLKNLNLEIPKAPDPVGAYIAYKKTANLLFISGQISIDTNGKIIKGKFYNHYCCIVLIQYSVFVSVNCVYRIISALNIKVWFNLVQKF